MTCTYCGHALSDEEQESPRMDGADILCDSCWSEKFESFCLVCEELMETDAEENKTHMVLPTAEIGVAPGIYRVLKLPWFRSNYFRMWVIPDSLERVADVPEKLRGEQVGGYICAGCAKASTP